MKELKYLKTVAARAFRNPLTSRRVCVNALDPVACTTVRPRAANSPIRLNAMTLFPLPGPPLIITAVLLVAGACLLDRVHHQVDCYGLLVEQNELPPGRPVLPATTASSWRDGAAAE